MKPARIHYEQEQQKSALRIWSSEWLKLEASKQVNKQIRNVPTRSSRDKRLSPSK